MKKFVLTAALAFAAVSAAAPAQAAFPVYPNPGTQNPQNYLVTAANTGVLRAIFVGKDAAHTSLLGVLVGGIDRGTGLNNQTATFGQVYNYGAITAGQTIEYYIFNTTTGQKYFLDKSKNPGNVQHFWRANYSGTDFGYAVTGGYYSGEDLPKGGDFDYNDMSWVSTTGAVPEPATWAMMIMGFGLIGGALRSAKGRQTARVRFA
ncbi:MAG: PEPxxWA-CTERM sorting domain-containing protein [Sphingopyxis sp.]|nr:PEPxxWA-CTERM sorting domain-containing protein [Sphingopyxis sp.]